LEIQGFKSFADPVTIDLNEGITCIVGPNGSGKSNISDALRWVLGEQSPKQLRGSKMDDVIFAGTATRKPKGMAEVTLVIDNSTGILPLDFSEVAVTRRMFRSGENDYLINGTQCRLRDIKELFMDTGIGVDGYSIIGQGKIQDIVSTKPENRREIFEESAGIVMYKSRKAEAERKLKASEENLDRVRDIIAEIEGRIGGLKKDSEKAQEYIKLRDRYRYVGVNIILHNVEGLERNIKAGQEELSSVSGELSGCVAESEKLEERMERLRSESADLGEKSEQTHAELLSKVEELNMINSRGQINSERLQTIEKELTRLDGVISDAENKLEAERANFAELEKNEKEYSEAGEKASKDLDDAVFRLNEHTRKHTALREQIEQDRSRVIELNNDIVSKKAEITTLDNYRKTLGERQEQLRAEYEGRDRTDSVNRDRLAEIDRQFSDKQEQLEEAKKRLAGVADRIKEVNRRAAELSNETDSENIKLNRANARKSTIEEMENNYEGYNTAVRSLMQKNMRGIIGTVSDLITVPDGYELAIETALGGALQNIVCEDDESAKAAVRWLKSARAGRATFLPVSSIKGHIQDLDPRIEDADGFLGIAAEKVGADSRYDGIVNYLLGRVIIADNMDSAVRISKIRHGGFRIVTLEGEVINAGGAITGGRYRNKTANLIERKKEIEDLASEIEAGKKKVEKLRQEREQCDVEIRELKDERGRIYDSMQELEVQFGVLRSDREHAEELVKSAGSAAEKYASEIESIDSDIGKAGEMIDKYQSAIEDAGREIEKLEQGVEEMSADADRYKSVLDEDNEAIVSCRLAVSEQETKILGLNELIERVRDDVTELETTLEDSKAEREELTEQRDLLTSSGEKSSENIERLTEEKKALEQRQADLQRLSDENSTGQDRAREEQKACAERLEKLRDAKYKLEIKAAKNETVLNSQKDKLWDDFEMSYAEAQDLRDENFGITAGNKEARDIKLRMSELGDVNISAIEEYKAVSRRYDFMTAQEDDISTAMDELREIIRNMDKTIKEKFRTNFDAIMVSFQEIFKELFGGGSAELRLEDESDPLNSGIEIIAQPPGKKLKNINLMSGGEKTMTAIALMFAVLKVKPTPFCILDEVEAALDEANIERFSDYLKHFDDVQFALITHQKATMEHADVLYGVTMPEQGISKVLSLKFEDGFDPDEYTE
jgi:chromosome segregation protein